MAVHALRTKMRNALLAGAALLAFGTYAVSSNAQDEQAYFGGALSTTGIQAPLDTPALEGALLAIEALNERGGLLGKEVKFRNLDGKSEPTTVGDVTAQLIADGANLIIAPCDFDIGSPANRAAQEAGLVGMSTCASSPLHGSATLGDLQFTMAMWNTQMGAAAAEYAFNERGWTKAYVITDTFIDYTTSLSEYFIKHFEQLGGEILNEDEYTQGAGDFSAQLSRMRSILQNQEADVIFISSYQPDLSMIIRTIRQAGIDLPVLGGDSYDDPGLWDALGTTFGSDVYFATHGYMEEGTAPGMEEFLERYEAAHGERPQTSFVATGWDTVMAIAQAVEIAGTTEGKAVARALEENEFELLTGTMDWSSAETGHEPNKSVAMVQLQNGETSFIGWVRPTNVPKPDYLVRFIEQQSGK